MASLGLITVSDKDENLCALNPEFIYAIYIDQDQPDTYVIAMPDGMEFDVKIDSPSGRLIKKLLGMANANPIIELSE